jgi:hypothetical protein
MRKATIPIEDIADNCSEGYIVEYKISTEPDYTRLLPDPFVSPVLIQNLQDDTEYNVRIKRKCCNGDVSAWTTITIDTTL